MASGAVGSLGCDDGESASGTGGSGGGSTTPDGVPTMTAAPTVASSVSNGVLQITVAVDEDTRRVKITLGDSSGVPNEFIGVGDVDTAGGTSVDVGVQLGMFAQVGETYYPAVTVWDAPRADEAQGEWTYSHYDVADDLAITENYQVDTWDVSGRTSPEADSGLRIPWIQPQ